MRWYAVAAEAKVATPSVRVVVPDTAYAVTTSDDVPAIAGFITIARAIRSACAQNRAEAPEPAAMDIPAACTAMYAGWS
jgi:orotidine-5'-phosphate decarboxylase